MGILDLIKFGVDKRAARKVEQLDDQVRAAEGNFSSLSNFVYFVSPLSKAAHGTNSGVASEGRRSGFRPREVDLPTRYWYAQRETPLPKQKDYASQI